MQPADEMLHARSFVSLTQQQAPVLFALLSLTLKPLTAMSCSVGISRFSTSCVTSSVPYTLSTLSDEIARLPLQFLNIAE